MRILFLTQWFQPEPFFKGLPFAKALKERGHDIEVLTGFPNYPGGKLYQGYRIRFHQKEVMDGITIHRVPLYPSHDKSTFRRIANYLSFSLSTLLMGLWLVKRPDVIYVYNLVTLGLPAFLIRFIHGSKVIIDVQDLWPESVVNSNMLRNKIILNILGSISNWIYRRASRLTVLSPGFKDSLVIRGMKPERIDVIYNWCDEKSLSGANAWEDLKPKNMEGKFVVLFAGAMGFAQGLDTLLDCADICRNELPSIHFVLIGGGVDRPRLQKLAEKMRLDNVTFLSPRPIEAMGEVYAMADALLVHLKDEPLFRITIPSKTQAYFYIGKPIIMAMKGDAAHLVRKAGAGIVCESDNPRSMFNGVKQLQNLTDNERKKMRQEARDFYLKNLSMDTGVTLFEKSFLSCME